MAATTTILPASIAERARRRITRRIMPYLFILYIIAFLDRVNVGYAALEMTRDLRFTPEVYGFGAGIFFLGYFLLEIPGTILVEKWSARGCIARIMILWGILAMVTGFIQTASQFYWIRFLLGAAEAGFFPGVIIYLSHWFRYEDRAKAMAMFTAAIPVSNMIGSPVSGLFLGVNWLGMAGWRWLFIFEGMPAIIFGIITIFYLTDWPEQATWLPEEERCWISAELEKEKNAKHTARQYSVWQAFRNRDVILLTLGYFFVVCSNYGYYFWAPTMIKKLSGLSNMAVTLVTAIPYCVGLVAMLVVGWSSDRTKERRWHTALCMAAIGTGLSLSVLTHGSTALTIFLFCVAAIGIHGYLPVFWSLPTSFLTGVAAAASVGLINSTGNLGGFVGPYVMGYLNRRTNSFVTGILCLSVSAFLAAGLILSVRATKQNTGR